MIEYYFFRIFIILTFINFFACLFISPLDADESVFEELGQRLKTNKVSIDVINFAHPENVPKLTALVNAANQDASSHFLDVPLGIASITDVLISSPIVMPEDMGGDSGQASGAGGEGGASRPAGASQFAEYGGIDPSLDPELAMAIRISLEEERARQQPGDAVGSQPATGLNAAGTSGQGDQPMVDASAAAHDEPAAEDEDDEEAILEQARLLSMQHDEQQKAAQSQPAQQQQQNYSDLINNEFVGDLVKDLGLEMDEAEINTLLKDVNKPEDAARKQKEEEEKKKKEQEDAKKK